MDFEEYSVGERDTEEEEKFRQEVRDFLDKELTPEIVQECQQYYDRGTQAREFSRKLGAKGWLLSTWPKEYGGLGLPSSYSRIIAEEVSSRGASMGGGFGNGIAGPMIMRHGSEEQKRGWLPKIARGEAEFSLGYTEPNAGTDLASLEMRAVPDGDDYIINGQKVYSTAAHWSTHHWLAARTNVDVPKHKGISLFIVDLASPGITIRPMWTMSDEITNEVFYDDVRVPKKNLVGEENQGWGYLREALASERAGLTSFLGAESESVVDELVQYARETKRSGRTLAEDPLVRQSLAQLAIENRIRRLYGYRTGWLQSKGIVPDVAAAIGKVWGNELDQRVANTGMQILGLYGQLEPDSKWALLRGKVEFLHRFAVHLTYGGGSHELMRSVIATGGMGLPREPRG